MQADSTCPFCQLPSARVELQNDLALAFEDGYQVLPGHRFVVPRRHVEDYSGLTPAERNPHHLQSPPSRKPRTHPVNPS